MSAILRPGLLEGVSVLVVTLRPPAQANPATETSSPPATNLTRQLSSLGARVIPFAAEWGELTSDWVGEQGALDALLLDASSWRPPGGDGDPGVGPLRELLDRVWMATAAVANGAMIPREAQGRILLVAPADRSLPTVPAAVAALDNLARSLSVEWARYGITTCTLAPAPDTRLPDLATVTAYLLSAAGAYFSGTRLDLDALSG